LTSSKGTRKNIKFIIIRSLCIYPAVIANICDIYIIKKLVQPKKEPQQQEISYLEKEREGVRVKERGVGRQAGRSAGRQPYLRLG
jgi:hypothetical protein